MTTLEELEAEVAQAQARLVAAREAHARAESMEVQKANLPGLIDWPRVMKAERRAGGHTEVFDVLFLLAEVIGVGWEGGYQGSVAYAYRLPNGQVILVTDYYGSCSVCDAWEDASDDSARTLVNSMVNNARIFENLEAAQAFIAEPMKAEDFAFEAAKEIEWKL